MNLRELLAQKANNPSVEEKEEKKESNYLSIEPPPPFLYTILVKFIIKRTYSPILETRDFIRFILEPYAYTLNRFEGLDHDKRTEIFNLFMLHFPPRSSYHLYCLYMTLWELELKVPAMYYDIIVDSIKNCGIDKKFQSSYNAIL